jgi:hypothetical protein
MSVLLDVALEVRCEGTYVPSRPSVFCREFGNWLPGECAHIENFKVFLGSVEITNQLSPRDLRELETDFLIQAEEGQDEIA